MDIQRMNPLAVAPEQTYYLPTQIHSLQEEDHFTSVIEAPSDYPFILIILSGSALLRLNRIEQTVRGCCVMICDKGSTLRLLEKQSLRAVLIEYRSLTLNHTAPQQLLGSTIPQPCSHRVHMLTSQLQAAWQHRSEHNFKIHRLFLELLEQVQLEWEDSVYRGSEWLHKVLEHIHLNYREELSREQLAALGGISPEHFSRSFHKHTGCTYNSYMNTLRIRDVQLQLLAGTDQSLHELALMVGYKDGYYLSRKFKQVVGTAPMIFLRKPKRILSANYNYTAMLLALQVNPILGAYSAWVQAIHPTVPIDQERELKWAGGYGSYEQVEALKPDFIIGYEHLANDMRLKSIAPVVALPFMKLDWREQFRQIAEVAGKQHQAEKLIEQYNEQAQHANTKLNQVLGGRGSLIIWEIHNEGAYAFGNRYGRGGHVLYDDLGFHIPEQLLKKGIQMEGYIQVPLDQIYNYSADYIIIVDLSYSPQIKQLFRTPKWLAFETVMQKRLIIMEQSDLFYGFDPLSTLEQLKLLVKGLTS